MGPDSYIRSPSHFTLNSSWVSATLLSSLSHTVNRLALESKNDSHAKEIQILHYFAKPIDSIIQATAMLVFTAYDHFRDISYDYKNGNKKTVVLKLLITPLQLPLKMVGASLVSIGFLSKGLFQLVIPYQTIYSVMEGKEAAHFYFYESDRWRSQFEDPSFRMKPITLLKSFDVNHCNPIYAQREKLLLEIDEPLRKRIGGKLNITGAYPNYLELVQKKTQDQNFILNNATSQDQNVKDKIVKADKDLKELERIERLIEVAKEKWKKIDRLSIGLEFVINNGIPIPLLIS